MSLDEIIGTTNFGKLELYGKGVVPVVVQDYRSREIAELFMADEKMLRMALEWQSVPMLLDGEYMPNCGPSIREAYLDCDNDAVLLLAEKELTSSPFSGFGPSYNMGEARDNKDMVLSELDFSALKYAKKKGGVEFLVPVAVQDYDTRGLLMVAFANRKAVSDTLSSGNATYWSREREELWVKGKTSGNNQLLQELKIRLDGEALIYSVVQFGNACHLPDRKSCFDNGRVL